MRQMLKRRTTFDLTTFAGTATSATLHLSAPLGALRRTSDQLFISLTLRHRRLSLIQMFSILL
jgi:hypothetical protein